MGGRRVYKQQKDLASQRQDAYQEAAFLPEGTATLDIDQARDLALRRNPGLQAAFEQWVAAVERIPQVSALPDPVFSYGYFIEEVETRVGPQKHRFGLAQAFPWFGKLRLQGEAAAAEALAVSEDFEKQRLDLYKRTTDLWLEYYFLEASIRTTRDNFTLLSDLEKVMQARVRSGEGLSNLSNIQMELARLEDRIASLQDERIALKAGINALLRREPDASLPPPGKLPDAVLNTDDAEQLRADLTARNPALRALDHKTDAADKRIERARREFYPDLTFRLDYIQTDDALMDTPDDGKDLIIAGVGLNIPIQIIRPKAAVREAQANRRRLGANRIGQTDRLLADLEMAFYRYRNAERQQTLYTDSLIPKAEESLEVALQSYQSGTVDFMNVIDQQRLLLELSLQAVRAGVDRVRAVTTVEVLTASALEKERNDE